MTDAQFRTFTADLEVRSLSGRRLISGILVPYGVIKEIRADLRERFEAGCFDHQFAAPNRIALREGHSISPSSRHIGHGVELPNAQAGLWGVFRVVDHEDGVRVIGLLGEGALKDWSIGFWPDKDRYAGGVTYRERVNAFEVAVLPEGQGAYSGWAEVAAMRSRPRPTPRLDHWRQSRRFDRR